MGLEKNFQCHVDQVQSLISKYEELSDLVIHYDFDSGSYEDFNSLHQSLNCIKEDMNTAFRCLSFFVVDNFDRIKFE